MKKLVKESLESSTDIEKLKRFAEENDLDFKMTSKGSPSVSVSLKEPKYVFKGYDQYGVPNLAMRISYGITYTDREIYPVSLRKSFYGLVGDWDTTRERKYGMHVTDVDRLLFLLDPKEKVINQTLMGRFSTVEEALDRIKLNVKKELK